MQCRGLGDLKLMLASQLGDTGVGCWVSSVPAEPSQEEQPLSFQEVTESKTLCFTFSIVLAADPSQWLSVL